MIGRFRWRSLAWRALGITALVGLAPQLFVWISSVSDARVGQGMLRETEDAARRAAVLLHKGEGSPRALDDIARRGAVRLRVLDAEDRVTLDLDHERGASVLYLVGRFFFGTDGAPTLAEFDASLPPLPDRMEVAAARSFGQDGGCQSSPAGKLLVCHHAAVVDTPQGRQLVYAQESSRRAIRALYDVRYQLARLTLFCGALALVVGGWLAWRIVHPIETLRRQVQARTRPVVSTAPVMLNRNDEVGDLALAFNELLGALRDRNAAYEGFVEDLAHEIKNPVAAIRAAAESMEAAETVEPDRARRLARVLRRSSQRLDDVVTELLELTRAEAGLAEHSVARVDLGALTAGLIDAMAPPEGGPTVTLHRGNGPLEVDGAPSQLETALRNLLANALSFARSAVEVRASRRDDAVFIEVTDDGPGIEPEALARVFERFFTTRKREGGTGLGLAMTRAVVEAHGGVVDAHSTPGEGARFTVRLPAASVSHTG
ncbi:MAG: HAMP domain-containing histidine kinase [Alphaproteobacteria bacterium]|nr:HAMP domain-containing histidine kinase [Alphaproteobacteria bacterium]